MAMIRWKPLQELSDFFENFDLAALNNLPTDIYEQDGNIVIKVSMPGVKPEDVDISLEDNHIRISGHKEEAQEEHKRNYYLQEIRSGKFERVIPIPFRVNVNDINAEFDKGNLIITLPQKHEEAKNKKIKAKVKEYTHKVVNEKKAEA